MRLLRHVTPLALAIPPQVTSLHLVIVPVISKRGLYLGLHSVDRCHVWLLGRLEPLVETL